MGDTSVSLDSTSLGSDGAAADLSGYTSGSDTGPVYDVGAVYTVDSTATADPAPSPSLDTLFNLPVVYNPDPLAFIDPASMLPSMTTPPVGSMTDLTSPDVSAVSNLIAGTAPIPPSSTTSRASGGGGSSGGGGGISLGGQPKQTPQQSVMPKSATQSSLLGGLSLPMILIVAGIAYLAFRQKRE